MTDTDRDVGQSDDEAHGFDTEFLDDTSDTHAAWFGFVDGLKAQLDDSWSLFTVADIDDLLTPS